MVVDQQHEICKSSLDFVQIRDWKTVQLTASAKKTITNNETKHTQRIAMTGE